MLRDINFISELNDVAVYYTKAWLNRKMCVWYEIQSTYTAGLLTVIRLLLKMDLKCGFCKKSQNWAVHF